jgi:hypothetical protein
VKTPGTYWIGDYVDRRVGLDAVEYKKIALSGIETGPSLPSVYQLSYPGLFHVLIRRNLVFEGLRLVIHRFDAE